MGKEFVGPDQAATQPPAWVEDKNQERHLEDTGSGLRGKEKGFFHFRLKRQRCKRKLTLNSSRGDAYNHQQAMRINEGMLMHRMLFSAQSQGHVSGTGHLQVEITSLSCPKDGLGGLGSACAAQDPFAMLGIIWCAPLFECIECRTAIWNYGAVTEKCATIYPPTCRKGQGIV